MYADAARGHERVAGVDEAIRRGNAYAEAGASKSDGESMGIIGGFSYRFSDTLSIGPGLGWFDDVGDVWVQAPEHVVENRKAASTGWMC